VLEGVAAEEGKEGSADAIHTRPDLARI
jgi:hypothetical protein